MKVAIISDSPAITTGFGVVTNQCCEALTVAGHSVFCFGFKHSATASNEQTAQYNIEPIDPKEQWQAKLRAFILKHSPHSLWIYIDMFNLQEIMEALSGISLPPMSIYAIFDGLPVYRKVLGLLSKFATIVVTTEVARSYLEREGYNVHGVAPPGVDPIVFNRLDKPALKNEGGLEGRFLVGSFGRNCERKQQYRLLFAMKMLLRDNPAHDILLYLHCSRSGYWDLEDLARMLGIADRVLYASKSFEETLGVPLKRTVTKGDLESPHIPEHFGYVERLNLCDLILNVPHSGDFEQVLIEAPACCVPVGGTDDQGIMSSALGPNLKLRASHIELGNVGQKLHYVSIEGIAETIIRAQQNRNQLDTLATAGRRYAVLHTWQNMQRVLLSAIESAAGGV